MSLTVRKFSAVFVGALGGIAAGLRRPPKSRARVRRCLDDRGEGAEVPGAAGDREGRPAASFDGRGTFSISAITTDATILRWAPPSRRRAGGISALFSRARPLLLQRRRLVCAARAGVCRGVPPPGLVISVLPPYYSTVWFGGIRTITPTTSTTRGDPMKTVMPWSIRPTMTRPSAPPERGATSAHRRT